jgi:hypothetical protein
MTQMRQIAAALVLSEVNRGHLPHLWHLRSRCADGAGRSQMAQMRQIAADLILSGVNRGLLPHPCHLRSARVQ